VEAKARHADDIRKDVELASIEADKILTDQVELDLRVKVRGGLVALDVTGGELIRWCRGKVRIISLSE
jgi:hypothetical protein